MARFKGGDNFVFGRGFEEVLACREAGVPVTVIPGISSPLAVPAVAGIPVTHRGVTHDLTIVSGHLPPGHPESLVQWGALASLRGTIVLMMAVENAPLIAEVLLRGGRDAATPVGDRVRRHHAHRAHRADHARRAGRRIADRAGAASGDHRDRRGGGGGPPRALPGPAAAQDG